MTSKKQPAPHLKEDFFTEHLPYEVSMLRATYDLVRAQRPAAEHNAFVHSFLLHARNLIEFYKDRPACDFDPRMFTNANYRVNRDFISDALVAKISKQTSHLTAKRMSQASDELTARDWALILRALEEETSRFVKALTSEYAEKWLMHQPQTPAKKARVEPSPATYVLRRANLPAKQAADS